MKKLKEFSAFPLSYFIDRVNESIKSMIQVKNSVADIISDDDESSLYLVQETVNNKNCYNAYKLKGGIPLLLGAYTASELKTLLDSLVPKTTTIAGLALDHNITSAELTNKLRYASATEDGIVSAADKRKWDALIQFDVKKVDVLPTSDISTHTIYLVPKQSGSETSNACDEFVYINNAWEKIGDTAVSLQGYATEQWVEDKHYLTTETQADWNESDTTSAAFIKNKPAIEIPENGKLTIKVGQAETAFTANQSTDVTIELDKVNDNEITLNDSIGNKIGSFTLNQNSDSVITLPVGSVPVGSIMLWTEETAPANWKILKDEVVTNGITYIKVYNTSDVKINAVTLQKEKCYKFVSNGTTYTYAEVSESEIDPDKIYAQAAESSSEGNKIIDLYYMCFDEAVINLKDITSGLFTTSVTEATMRYSDDDQEVQEQISLLYKINTVDKSINGLNTIIKYK